MRHFSREVLGAAEAVLVDDAPGGCVLRTGRVDAEKLASLETEDDVASALNTAAENVQG